MHIEFQYSENQKKRIQWKFILPYITKSFHYRTPCPLRMVPGPKEAQMQCEKLSANGDTEHGQRDTAASHLGDAWHRVEAFPTQVLHNDQSFIEYDPGASRNSYSNEEAV